MTDSAHLYDVVVQLPSTEAGEASQPQHEPRQRAIRADSHTDEEWEGIRVAFTALYLRPDKTLFDVAEEIRTKYGFHAT